MQKGNANGALKLLSNNMSGGVLTDETLELLIQKHPEAVNVKVIALKGPMQQVSSHTLWRN